MAQNIEIRKAAEADISRIIEVIEEAQAFLKSQGHDQWQNGYPNEKSFRADIQNENAYVFLKNGRLCGVLTLTVGIEPAYEEVRDIWQNGESYAAIHRMAVAKEERGSGIAHEMIEFAKEKSREKGAKSLRIDTHRGNIPMQRLLKKENFSYAGEIDYHFHGADPIRLGYEISLKK